MLMLGGEQDKGSVGKGSIKGKGKQKNKMKRKGKSKVDKANCEGQEL